MLLMWLMLHIRRDMSNKFFLLKALTLFFKVLHLLHMLHNDHDEAIKDISYDSEY